MILAHGIGAVYENKEKMTGYKFFTGFTSKLIDGMSGLGQPLILCKQDRVVIGTFLPNNENKRLVVTKKFLPIWSSSENDRIGSVIRRLLFVIPVQKPSENGSHP